MSAHIGAIGQPTDSVDRLAAGWDKVLPDSDISPLQVLSRITRISHHLDSARRSVFSVHNLQLWEFDVLSALRRSESGAGLTPGALVLETLVTSGTMTNRIDRLKEHGLVTRHPGTDDRRSVKIRLTMEGVRIADAAMKDLLEQEHELVASLDGSDAELLARLLRSLLASLEKPATGQIQLENPISGA